MTYNPHQEGETKKHKRSESTIRRAVMPFNSEKAEEKVTTPRGLVLYREFAGAMGVDSLIERHMSKPSSGRGDVINYSEGKGFRWAICVGKDSPVVEAVGRISQFG